MQTSFLTRMLVVLGLALLSCSRPNQSSQESTASRASDKGEPEVTQHAVESDAVPDSEREITSNQTPGTTLLLDDATVPWPEPARQKQLRPDLVLITIDALRADRLPCYGYERPTTPALCRLAAEGTLFEAAFAHASETQTSVASLMAGRFPASARWETWAEGEGLAERLARSGYHSIALVGNSWLDPVRGYARGFNHYLMFDYAAPDSVDLSATVRVDGKTLIEEALKRYFELPTPRFLWLHLMDVHAPYRPPPPFLGRFGNMVGRERYVNGPRSANTGENDLAYMSARYDESLNYLDASLNPLLSRLTTGPNAARTWIWVSSDHGESLGEGGELGHGTSLRIEQIRVPLIARAPTGARRTRTRIARPVGLWDLAPTLLGLAGIDSAPPSLSAGRDLRGLLAEDPLLSSAPPFPDRPIPLAIRSVLDQHLKVGAIVGDWKLDGDPSNPGTHRLQRWRAASQPEVGERKSGHASEVTLSLNPESPAVADQFYSLIWKQIQAPGPRLEPARLGPGERAKLEALGYIGSP